MSVQQNEYLSIQQLYELAKKAMQAYPVGYQGEIKLLCQSENATFMVKAAQQQYALRIHRPNYHSKQDIESELAWLDALNAHGIAVPIAIADCQGNKVQTLALSPDISRHAVLFHWVQGVMPTAENVDPCDFKQLGEITAQLHQHSKTWDLPSDFQRIVWDHESMILPEGHWGNWRHAPQLKLADHAVIDEAICRISTELNQFGKSKDRYGLIHADLRLTNLLLNDKKVGVIDFDDCGMSWFMHDLAAAISFNEHYAAAPEWIEKWLNGYEKIGHVSTEEYALIPTFIMQRRIQLMAWFGSHAYTDMAKSLGEQWSDETVRLCKKYLNNQIPAGV
ncbi:phosphotransferase enzyme family protein [Acinetobacter johnsonii]|uniref:phosphotransferase enzyme family protein n=1 Tax=Acinetobacter johnsonii TaxID=40214 RepID=UPI003984E0AA